jgi:hypothetical protein
LNISLELTGICVSGLLISFGAGKKDLAELHGLKQAGLTLVKIESFKNGVIDIIVNAAFNAIP